MRQGSVKVVLPISCPPGRMVPLGAADCTTELARPPEPAIPLDFDGDRPDTPVCLTAVLSGATVRLLEARAPIATVKRGPRFDEIREAP